jgi:hypothetical protein
MRDGPLPDDRRSPLSDLDADALIAASGAQPSDRIIIAGSDQLGLMIALIRRGFANVICQSGTCGPHSPAGQCDILIMPSLRNEPDLAQILRHLGGALRRHGVVVLRASPFARGSERLLRQTLMDGGFSAVERVPGRGRHGDLWCAHKYGAALARAA